MILGPFDEIGNDQEIAGKTHPFDDAQLEFKPFLVVLHRGRMRDHRQPVLQPRTRLPLEFLDLVIGEFRQDRITPIGHESTALGDFNGIINRFRKIGKQRHHFLWRLEVMLRRQAAAGFLLVDISPVRNADQRIMRFVHVGFREIDIVCRHQRQTHRIGHLDKGALGGAFVFGQAGLARMALHFDIKPVTEHPRQPLHDGFGRATIALLQHAPDRAVRATGQADHALAVPLQLVQRDMRQLSRHGADRDRS